MVFQGILGKLGLSGISGLAQGGGFGLGYGFMVRMGYDLYGALKDKAISSLTGLRYTPDTSTSMAGTGGLMGLKHNPGNRVDNTTLNNMTSQQRDSLAKKLGGAHKIQNFLQSRGQQSNSAQGSGTVKVGNRTYSKQISRITGRMETDYQFRRRIAKTSKRQTFIDSMYRL